MKSALRSYISITSESARRLLSGLLSEAESDGGKPIAVAVVDDRGDLIAFGRLDGTPVRSITIAINKAYTACRTQQSTAALASALAKANRSVDVYTDPRFTTFPGGVPLQTTGGTVVGAVGISGRAPEDDESLAERWSTYVDLSDE